MTMLEHAQRKRELRSSRSYGPEHAESLTLIDMPMYANFRKWPDSKVLENCAVKRFYGSPTSLRYSIWDGCHE